MGLNGPSRCGTFSTLDGSFIFPIALRFLFWGAKRRCMVGGKLWQNSQGGSDAPRSPPVAAKLHSIESETRTAERKNEGKCDLVPSIGNDGTAHTHGEKRMKRGEENATCLAALCVCVCCDRSLMISHFAMQCIYVVRCISRSLVACSGKRALRGPVPLVMS